MCSERTCCGMPKRSRRPLLHVHVSGEVQMLALGSHVEPKVVDGGSDGDGGGSDGGGDGGDHGATRGQEECPPRTMAVVGLTPAVTEMLLVHELQLLEQAQPVEFGQRAMDTRAVPKMRSHAAQQLAIELGIGVVWCEPGEWTPNWKHQPTPTAWQSARGSGEMGGG